MKKKGILLINLMALYGCSGSNTASFSDLESFLKKEQTRPLQKEDITMVPKETNNFTYSALQLRSPFEIPKLFVPPMAGSGPLSKIRPDFNRAPHPLESFSMETLFMVGTVKNSKELWGLVRANGTIYRVKSGDYLGRNHGKITQINENDIEITELIPVGTEAWVEKNTILTINPPN